MQDILTMQPHMKSRIQQSRVSQCGKVLRCIEFNSQNSSGSSELKSTHLKAAKGETHCNRGHQTASKQKCGCHLTSLLRHHFLLVYQGRHRAEQCPCQTNPGDVTIGTKIWYGLLNNDLATLIICGWRKMICFNFVLLEQFGQEISQRDSLASLTCITQAELTINKP